MAAIRLTLAQHLKGLDDDILDYLVGLLESESKPSDDLRETVSQFLLSSGFAADDKVANKHTGDVFAALYPGSCLPPPPPATSAPPSAGLAELSLDSRSAANESPAGAAPVVKAAAKARAGKKEKNEELAPVEKKVSRETKSKLAAKNKVVTPYDKAKQNDEELEAELELARMNAAKLRSQVGAYNGAIESTSFVLPNPGGGANLLENASMVLVRGARYALIGRNGKGKSTLLRALAARRVGDIPSNVTMHYVSQEVKMTDTSKEMLPVDIVLEADVERRLLLEEVEQLEADPELTSEQQLRLNDALEQLDLIESESAPRRATELLTNLGFSDEMKGRKLKEMSGGWRVRTMLAAALFARPDMLLLDEPTNHLALGAVLWLVRELSTNEIWSDKIVIIVSHDRFFIDEVCTDCLHISGVAQRLTQSHGNYSMWAKRRKQQQALFQKETELRNAKIEQLEAYAGHGFKYGGSSTQLTQMTKKAREAEKLEEEAKNEAEEAAALQEDVELPLKLQSGGEVEGFLINIMNVSFGYPGAKTLFSKVELGITSKSRVVLLGENGNGKTTLVKLIQGDLKPTAGEIKLANGLRIALVNQHHADQIDLTQTPLSYLLEKFPGDGKQEHIQSLRAHLSSCGITSGSVAANIPDLQNVCCSALSGGQRSRLALAAVSYAKPHVLVSTPHAAVFLHNQLYCLNLETLPLTAPSICPPSPLSPFFLFSSPSAPPSLSFRPDSR